jgi:hypothetical protein
MIIARNFRKTESPYGVDLSCDIVSDVLIDRLVFSVHKSNADAAEIDEPNWAAITLLYPAMLFGEDLAIEADISPMLLHNMRQDLMALLRNYEPATKDIRIEAGETSDPEYTHKGKDVVTGYSGGVDSSATFVRYTAADVPDGLRLTGLANFDFGALHNRRPEGRDVHEEARLRVKEHADENGLKTYAVASNLVEFFGPVMKRDRHPQLGKTVGFRNAAGAFALQREVGLFLPSGNVGYDLARYGPDHCTEHLDSVLQPLLSSEALRVIPSCAGLSRQRKIELISDNSQIQKRLDVCVNGDIGLRYQNDHINCSRCWKCVQTLSYLDATNRLVEFSNVFDVDFYLRNRTKLLKDTFSELTEMGAIAEISVMSTARVRGVPVPMPPAKWLRPIKKLIHLARRLKNKARRLARSAGGYILRKLTNNRISR